MTNSKLSLVLLAAVALTAAAAPVKIVLIGDSTVNDEGGWGPGFRAGLKPAFVTIDNHAKNGRSSRSFLGEGLWTKALAAKPQYVLIQFGHNDVPGKGADRETDPATTYRANLQRYIDETRAAGAQPVLVTSIVRRAFTADGRFRPDSLAPYVAEVRRIAAEQKIPLMDLYTLTMRQAEKLGPQGAVHIGRIGPDGKQDNTHLGPKGQREIGLMAAREFVRVVPALGDALAGVAMPPLRVRVQADGKAEYSGIMNAIGRAPVAEGQRLIIELAPGIYRERVIVTPDHPRVSLVGSGDPAKTVITYDMSAKAAGGTSLSATVQVHAPEFEAENVTFENSFGVGSQAVAILIHSDRATFRNCRFIGWQDTLYAASGRQYFKDCYIEGHVDFIFGNAAAVFENCTIHSKGSGFVTAHSRLTAQASTGYVFERCKLTGVEGAKVYLGRPWRPYARVVFRNCELGAQIAPAGWDNWSSAANEATAWFGETGSTGPGANPASRVKWARETAPGDFDPVRFLLGDDVWTPSFDLARPE